ncbi:Putative ATP-dependent RNA helicase DDX27 [Trichuris trichiura]|uniref:RNA helicase n=1 Tax=Trichuris trichiura TaxID=36087 RepID=A0A077ZH35_TRITR|nr:Putative ATP-dependent RNA helicase DDX27 [Trichuris trichiura]
MKRLAVKRCSDFNPSFVFEETSDQIFEEKMKFIKDMAKHGTAVDLDSHIKRARKKRIEKDEQPSNDKTVCLNTDRLVSRIGGDKSRNDDANFKNVADIVRDKKKKAVTKQKKKDDFFQADAALDVSLTFEEMNLSRMIARAISSMGYVHPTPVQSACIPIALLGKDLCVCAATGTGKTAAYLIPVLERLLFRPCGARKTRVLVLLPTRELAIQVYDTALRLAQFTNITFGLSSGGQFS